MIKIRPTFWVVLCLLIGSIFAASVWGSLVYFRLIYLWVFLIATSWIWTALSLRGIRVRRQARTTRQQVGQVFEERFEIDNDTRYLHLWIAVHDQSTLPGSAGSRVITWIGGRQQRSYVSYTWLTRRGLFPLGKTVISSGDLFGLFAVTREIPHQQSLLVTPFFVEISSFPSPAGLLPGGRALQRRTPEVTPYAASVREYMPGDSLNRIHWASTARRDRLMVKEFDQDPQADVWIFVDAMNYVQSSLPDALPRQKADRLWLWRHRPDEISLPPATIEYAISIAASVARFFISKSRAVGMVSSGQVYTVLPAERGDRQIGKIIENLAYLEAEGDTPMIGLTTAQTGYLPRGSTVVLITPSTQTSLVHAVDDLVDRSMKPVVVLIDPASFGSSRSSAEVAGSILERQIPVIQVSREVDLRLALEQSAVTEGQPAWWRDNDAA